MRLELIGGPFDGALVDIAPGYERLEVYVPRSCLPDMTSNDEVSYTADDGPRVVVYERAQWPISHGEWETADGHRLVQRVTQDALRYVGDE